jgi:hypothetical protein
MNDNVLKDIIYKKDDCKFKPISAWPIRVKVVWPFLNLFWFILKSLISKSPHQIAYS